MVHKYIGDQKLIEDFALKELKIKTLPMPEDAFVVTGEGYECLEKYHQLHTKTIITQLLYTINQLRRLFSHKLFMHMFL
jgi:hypothetical protein